MTYLQNRLPIELLQILILIGLSYWIYAANRKIEKFETKARKGIIELRIAILCLLFFFSYIYK